MSAKPRLQIFKHEETGPRGGIQLVGYVLVDTATGIAVRRRLRRCDLIDERSRLNSESLRSIPIEPPRA